MKTDWANYPLSVFGAAARSTVGGLASLIAGLSVGTWLGFVVLADDLDFLTDPTCWTFFALVAFLGPIAVSCIQLWGFLHVGLIIVVLHMLVHEDASRLRMAAFVSLPQFLCTVVAYGILRGVDWDMALRFSIVAPVAGVLAAAPLIVDRRYRRKQPTTGCSPISDRADAV